MMNESPHLRCPTPTCATPHVVSNGSHHGHPRFHCRTCGRYFGAPQGTPMYGLRTPAAQVAQALLVVMRRGSLRAAEERKYETIGLWLRRAAAWVVDAGITAKQEVFQQIHTTVMQIRALRAQAQSLASQSAPDGSADAPTLPEDRAATE
jgi:transposase-like protein